MKVSAQYAESHFAEMLDVASSGEEVEIALPGRPALKLVVSNAKPAAETEGASGRALLYSGEGLVKVPTAEEWMRMDEEIVAEMLGEAKFPAE